MLNANLGIIDVRSHRSVPETIDRLDSLATARGMTIFGRIDFSGDAERAGLSMRPMQMLIFGNPKAGTPLLMAAPRIGLDLPLKALAWTDEKGNVWLSCNSPEYLAARHELPQDLSQNVAGVVQLIEKATEP
jgi:uncharacterized protein (DUF302 family)